MQQPELRVVSLLAASTELVYRLGMAHTLVGRSHECDYPPVVLQLPECSEPDLDPSMRSISIDNAVREHAEDGRSMYNIHADKLMQLRPNVIITQSHCRVCAVTEDDVAAAIQDWVASQQGVCRMNQGTAVVEGGVRFLTLHPNSLQDIMRDVGRVAEALGVPERGQALAALLDSRFEQVRQAVAPQGAAQDVRPKAVVLEWLEPLMGCGSWIPELVRIAGAECVFGSHEAKVDVLTLQQLADADVDVIVFAPCGFGIRRTTQELRTCSLLEQPLWQGMRAVQQGAVFVADGNNFINRSGPRCAESAEMLAEMVWPRLLGRWGHHGAAFVSLSQAMAAEQLQGQPSDPRRPAWTSDDHTDAAETATQFAAGKPSSDACASHSRQVGDDNGTGPQLPDRLAQLARDLSSPVGTVRLQTQYLQQGRFLEAFQLNSPANQQRLGSADMFRAICRDPLYAALADAIAWTPSFSEQAPPLSHDCVEVAVSASPAGTQQAHSASQQGQSSSMSGKHYVFKMRKQADGLLRGCWLTDSVRPSNMCNA